MYKSQRIVFGTGLQGGHHLLPEVLEAGWGQFEVADAGHLRPHSHAGAFEICFILSGEVEWATTDSSDVLREGDTYLTQPDETHWGRDAVMHPCTLYWLILGSLDCGYPWPNLDPFLAQQLNARLRQIQAHRIRGTRRLRDAFTELFDEHAAPSGTQEQEAVRRGSARTALHRLVIEFVRMHDPHLAIEPAPEQSCQLPPAAAQAIRLLQRHPHDPDIVRRICGATGTDYKTINQQFIKHLGTTISQFRLRQRVRMARALLLETRITITNLAAELGFSSSQHFATVFRKITGLTPNQYRSTAVRSAPLRTLDEYPGLGQHVIPGDHDTNSREEEC